MESPQKGTNGNKGTSFHEMSGQVSTGGYTFSNYRLVVLCLGLLNAVLLIAAVVIGINCARVKDGSLHISHPTAAHLISELADLRSNHSDMIEAEVDAKATLERAIKSHAQLKVKIEQLKTNNDVSQRQMAALRAEKTSLQANISALEGTCGKCLSGWIFVNSSCYFFSYTESSIVKKNWLDSRADCIRRGSDLIVIDNQEEQKFVSSSITNMRSANNVWRNGFWIGLSDRDADGKWMWINNVTEVEKRYWVSEEQNNLYQGDDCAVAVYSNNNPWETRYNGQCSMQNLHWICETPSR